MVVSGSWKFRVLLKNLNVNIKISEIKKFFKPIRIKDCKILKRGIAVVYFRSKEDLDKALQMQGNLHGCPVTICSYDSDLFINTPSAEKIKPTFEAVPLKQLRSEIKESGRLFVRNLSYDCTEEELQQLFSKFGTISELHLSYDPKLQKSKGFAFVTYLFPEEAVKAFNKLDKTKFKDRLLHILPAKAREEEDEKFQDKKEDKEDEFATEKDRAIMSEFQKSKQKQLKAVASVSHNWNTLFISPDAVATYMASKFGVSKEQLLDSTSKESAAVRLAHGEAQLVHDIRDFLSRHGVRLDLLSSSSSATGSGRRDKAEANSAATHREVAGGRVFLLKNLPVGSSEAEVADLIRRLTRKGASQLEPPTRILVPPLGITAIVEYAAPQIAKLAYKAIAYEPYNDSILYVQWAPKDIFTPAKPGEVVNNDEEAEAAEVEVPVGDPDLLAPPDEQKETGEVAEVESRRKKKNKYPRKDEAMKPETQDENQGEKTEKSHKIKRGCHAEDDEKEVDDNQAIEGGNEGSESSKPSRKRQKTTSESAVADDEISIVRKPKEAVSRVIIVRNVAFQASQNELTALFKPIGGLVKVRMPIKPSGRHRGFAFVEFSTEDQAKSALETFGVDTHFMGRRLNIEYARQG